MARTSEAIVIRAYGGAEVLVAETVPVPDPGPGQVLIRQEAVSVNFHDVYVRSGAYKTLALPGIPGLEAVGVIEDVGEGVADLTVGQRVAYIDKSYGAYAAIRVLDAELAAPVPGGVEPGIATAWFLKGLTAQALVDEVEPVREGMTVLAQAAAGGVGQLVARMAKLRGATVIGTVGSPEKVAVAKAAGCDHVILYREEDVAARVAEITGGAGVNVAFDAVGKDSFEGSLASLASLGHLVHYGQASGPIPPFDLSRLGARSAKVSRPFLWPYIQPRAKLLSASESLFAAMARGDLPLSLGGRYPLAQAAAAHAALEAREAGPFVLDC